VTSIAAPPTPALIAQALREAITSGEIKAGMPLRQDHIAREFGVSHIPVREALKELAAEGIAVFIKNRGVVVSELSADVAWELTEYRCLLEGNLARWAVPAMTRDDFTQAREILQHLDQETQITEILRLAMHFHEIIYRRANRPFFLKSIASVRANLARYWRLAWEDRDYKPQSQKEHRDILRLCRRGDPEAVGKEIERHIRATGSLIVSYIQQHQAQAPVSRRSRTLAGPRLVSKPARGPRRA
jgi:DNA-binding GntR family transcriptional regulator